MMSLWQHPEVSNVNMREVDSRQHLMSEICRKPPEMSQYLSVSETDSSG